MRRTSFPGAVVVLGAVVTFVSPFITFATLNTQLSSLEQDIQHLTGGCNFTVIVPAQQYITGGFMHPWALKDENF